MVTEEDNNSTRNDMVPKEITIKDIMRDLMKIALWERYYFYASRVD